MMQKEKPLPSIWHSNVAVGSVSENVNVALVLLLGFGGAESIVGRGGWSEVARPAASGTPRTRAATATTRR
jgi:hypothetical protein